MISKKQFDEAAEKTASSYYIILQRLIKNTGESEYEIRKAFQKYVPKEDYQHEDTDALLNHLYLAAKPPKSRQTTA